MREQLQHCLLSSFQFQAHYINSISNTHLISICCVILHQSYYGTRLDTYHGRCVCNHIVLGGWCHKSCLIDTFLQHILPFAVVCIKALVIWWPRFHFSLLYNVAPLLLGRPTSMLVDLYFTWILSFFFRHIPSELAEQNSTKIGHMVGSECDLKTHVKNLRYPFSLQIGVPKTTFLDYFAT